MCSSDLDPERARGRRTRTERRRRGDRDLGEIEPSHGVDVFVGRIDGGVRLESRSDALGLALVMDEYGSFEGVVTAGDVLAAIVGEAPANDPQPGADGVQGEDNLVLDGLMPVDEFKLRLELYQGGKAYRQPRVESPKP